MSQGLAGSSAVTISNPGPLTPTGSRVGTWLPDLAVVGYSSLCSLRAGNPGNFPSFISQMVPGEGGKFDAGKGCSI